MLGWAAIVCLLLIGLFLYKMSHFRHRTSYMLIVLLILFLFATMGIVYTKYHLDFSTTDGFFNSIKIYGGWLGNAFGNVKILTGNAIKMDWQSTNLSFFPNNTSLAKT